MKTPTLLRELDALRRAGGQWRRASAPLLVLVILLAFACGRSKRSPAEQEQAEGGAGATPGDSPRGGQGGQFASGGAEPLPLGGKSHAGSAGREDSPLPSPMPYVGPTWSTVAHVEFLPEPGGNAHASSIVGDLDGDGLDELVITDEDYQLAHARAAGVLGAAYLFYGRAEWPQELSLADADQVLLGATTASGMGDVDGDGLADLVLGSYCDCEAFATNDYCVCDVSSGVQFVFGSETRGTGIARSDLVGVHYPADGMQISGVVAPGDVNGDALADVMVRDLGVRLIPGGPQRRTDPQGLGNFEYFGRAGWLSAAWPAADLDADGFDDLVVTFTLDQQGPNASVLELYYGPRQLAGGIGAPNATTLVTSASFWPAPIGDLDADGHADLALPGSARVRFMYGTPQRWSGELDPELRDFSIITRYGYFTSMLSADFNGDDRLDLLFGSYAGPSSRLLLVAGTPDRLKGDLIIGEEQAIGTSEILPSAAYVSTAGDVNGDGFDDMAIRTTDDRVRLLLGGPFDSP